MKTSISGGILLSDQPAARQLCLVLEDNWLIAQGLSDQLLRLGFEAIECHATCSGALAFLDQVASYPPDLALLDVKLGSNETCLPVALELQRLNVPFVITSGYGEAHELADQLPGVLTLQKPVFDTELSEMVDLVLA